MKKFLFGCTGFAFLAGSSPVAAQATDPFIGQTFTFAGNYCPTGWAAMNGQLLPINQNQALFSLLDTAYGGDGQNTFALPTAKPIFDANGVAFTQCIALNGVFPGKP